MSDQNPPTPSFFKELLSKTITLFVLCGTIVVAGVGIVFASIALQFPEEKVKLAFSILQYVFGALLPLWGTWIGTVIAYYYSKENFESANKSVQQMVDKISTEKKLQSLKARDVMIKRENLVVQIMGAGETLAKFRLKEDCLEFITAKGIRRLIILDDKGLALYVIHRDLISYFIAAETVEGRQVAGYTLSDMLNNGSPDIQFTMNNSVKFISQEANLLEAKNIMQQNKSCMDVFITATGSNQEPVLGWITNITISDNSVV